MNLVSERLKLSHILLLAIPLSLSAFTHLWSPAGFPYFVGDEGHYIRRALHVLEQSDPQEGARYDHPYFGQLFLAGIFKLIGYPGSLNPVPGDVNSTQMLYMVPRVIIGLLAVLDTFLIYKICERLYTGNKAIAFISSTLFAVMPLTWLTRRIYLDSIQLPFILLSILFAVYYYKSIRTETKKSRRSQGELVDKRTLLILFSGITLGLAIFTKIPALVTIPVIAYLIFMQPMRYSEKLKALAIWFTPVILIPAIWPAYAISVGEYDNWYSGVFSQAGREGSGIGSIGILFKIDPVLVSIGVIGIVFATIMKRDLFLLIWIVPFLAFHTIVPWTQHFHWLQVLPAFCIAGAVLIHGIIIKLGRKTTHGYRAQDYGPLRGFSKRNNSTIHLVNSSTLLQTYNNWISQRFGSLTLAGVIAITTIIIFGSISTGMLITTNVNASFFELVTFLNQALPDYHEDTSVLTDASTYVLSSTDITNNNKSREKITMVGNHWIFGTFWIPKYVFGKDHDFKGFFTRGSVESEKVIIVADRRLLDAISSNDPEKHIKELRSLYNNATTVASFKENRPEFNEDMYPYQSMSENRGIGKIEIKAINHILVNTSDSLTNLQITDARGSIISLQNDENNTTWITQGQWRLTAAENQANSSEVSFYATLDMVKPDNTDGHEHEFADFRLINTSIKSNINSSNITLNGTGTISGENGLYTKIPISINILDEGPLESFIDVQTKTIEPTWTPGGGVIGIWIEPGRFNDHFGNTPIYGFVKKADDIKTDSLYHE